jgi:hypothetical protein
MFQNKLCRTLKVKTRGRADAVYVMTRIIFDLSTKIKTVCSTLRSCYLSNADQVKGPNFAGDADLVRSKSTATEF